MKSYKTGLAVLLGALALVFLFMISCDELPFKGTEKVNVAPRVFWADIRWALDHSQNPNLRWWSRDIDGQVIDYQYSVLLDSTVQALGGADAVAANFPSFATWTIVHEDSSTIQLYASLDPDEFVPQYVFLKAMDDDSAFSEIIYSFLRRNNHAPTCYLVLPYIDTNGNNHYDRGEPPDPQWCLPETTGSWQGIRVAWIGKDSIDIEGIQPDFQWNLRIYGPFDAEPDSTDTTSQNLLVEYTDAAGVPWVWDKQKYLTNLVTGWYIIYARNRDDAFVSAVPAIGFLRVYEPRWIRHSDSRPVMVANHSWYYAGPQVPNPLAGEMLVAYRDSVNLFYRQLLADAGYTLGDSDWFDYTSGNFEFIPQKAYLYNHRLVIVIDNDWSRAFRTESQLDQETPYGQYLDVGGQVWVIGRRSFDGQTDVGFKEFGPFYHPVALTYFNLSGSFNEAMAIPAQVEFAGAVSLISEFPDLVLAPERVRQTSNVNYTYENALRGVSYLIRLNDSETIYRFNATNPDTSRFHNFPVAIRYDSGTFKTSCFSFPLYFINYDQALMVTENMLDWFLSEQ